MLGADGAPGSIDNARAMQQPAVDNRTDFAVHPQLLADAEGERLVVIVKATFELDGGEVVLAPPRRARPVRFADVPWEKEKPESVAFPADVCLGKPGTDVVFLARACAPGGRPAPSFDVRVEVGPLSKSLVVFGRRFWVEKGAGLSAPTPIAEIDMRYDHAWGGRDDEDPAAFLEEPRNPVGMGVTRKPAGLTHKEAPSIEDPSFPIRSVRTAPPPAGVGPIGRGWEPRRRYAGTYDDAWRDHRAPLLPEDFDERFNLCASPGLVATPPLAGGEPVRLLNLTPGGGALSFDLPRVALEIEIRVKGREPAVRRPYPDTVLIDTYAAGPDKPVAIETGVARARQGAAPPQGRARRRARAGALVRALAAVVAVGAVTPVGLHAVDTGFSHRAAAAAMREAPLVDAEGEPITMCFLPTLDPWMTGAARVSALATRALDEALEALGPAARGSGRGSA